MVAISFVVAKGPRARTQHMSDNGTYDVPRLTLGFGGVNKKTADKSTKT
jgi:hypothetical protein